MTMLNKDSSDPSLTRPSVLWLGINLETSLFKQGWRGGDGILVMDLLFSGSAVATAFAPASARSLGGSPGADADCGLHRQHLEDGTCVGFVVRGWQVCFPSAAS